MTDTSVCSFFGYVPFEVQNPKMYEIYICLALRLKHESIVRRNTTFIIKITKGHLLNVIQ